jgi:hypothetical protein
MAVSTVAGGSGNAGNSEGAGNSRNSGSAETANTAGGTKTAGTSTEVGIRFRRSARWERRYRRESAAAFSSVPHYRALWSATSIGEPTPIELAEQRVPELFPLRANRPQTAPTSHHGLRRALRAAGVREPSEIHDACKPLPQDARPGAVLHQPLLGYPAALGECGNWHVIYQDFYIRVLADSGLLAYTALRAEGPRLVDITLGEAAPARLGSCPRHGSPTVTS